MKCDYNRGSYYDHYNYSEMFYSTFSFIVLSVVTVSLLSDYLIFDPSTELQAHKGKNIAITSLESNIMSGT